MTAFLPARAPPPLPSAAPHPAVGVQSQVSRMAGELDELVTERRSASQPHCGWRQPATGALKASPPGGPDGPALTAPPTTRPCLPAEVSPTDAPANQRRDGHQRQTCGLRLRRRLLTPSASSGTAMCTPATRRPTRTESLLGASRALSSPGVGPVHRQRVTGMRCTLASREGARASLGSVAGAVGRPRGVPLRGERGRPSHL
jgi:hypothetical protein